MREDEAVFRGNLDPEMLVRLQINRCNITQTSGDEVGFSYAVKNLLANIPSGKRREIEANKEIYEEEKEEWRYEYYCGVKLGTPNKPMLNADGTPRSPMLEKVTRTDWYKLYTIIQEKLEEANLSWRVDQINEELGRIPKDKKVPPPTPTLAPGITIENLPKEDEEEEDE